jgi:hypothetical protein
MAHTEVARNALALLGRIAASIAGSVPISMVRLGADMR